MEVATVYPAEQTTIAIPTGRQYWEEATVRSVTAAIHAVRVSGLGADSFDDQTRGDVSRVMQRVFSGRGGGDRAPANTTYKFLDPALRTYEFTAYGEPLSAAEIAARRIGLSDITWLYRHGGCTFTDYPEFADAWVPTIGVTVDPCGADGSAIVVCVELSGAQKSALFGGIPLNVVITHQNRVPAASGVNAPFVPTDVLVAMARMTDRLKTEEVRHTTEEYNNVA